MAHREDKQDTWYDPNMLLRLLFQALAITLNSCVHKDDDCPHKVFSLSVWQPKHPGNVCTPGCHAQTQTDAPMCRVTVCFSFDLQLFLFFKANHFNIHTQAHAYTKAWIATGPLNNWTICGLYRVFVGYTKHMFQCWPIMFFTDSYLELKSVDFRVICSLRADLAQGHSFKTI